jgi:hypothetical protein
MPCFGIAFQLSHVHINNAAVVLRGGNIGNATSTSINRSRNSGRSTTSSTNRLGSSDSAERTA